MDLIRQSGVVPYRYTGEELEVLLITNSGGGRWLVPKGHIERDLTPRQSAIKEAYEEAGVIGTVDPHPLGSFCYVKRGVQRVVDLYAMAVAAALSAWPEMAVRRRAWTTPEHAAMLVRYPRLDQCILRLRDLMADSRSIEAA